LQLAARAEPDRPGQAYQQASDGQRNDGNDDVLERLKPLDQ
jgi:hypothetical protein